MKKLWLVLMVSGLLAMSACSNTFEGFGKDLQDLGKSIEKSTKE